MLWGLDEGMFLVMSTLVLSQLEEVIWTSFFGIKQVVASVSSTK